MAKGFSYYSKCKGSYLHSFQKEVTDTTHTGCCENELLGDMVECRKTRQEAVAIIQVREDGGLDQDAACLPTSWAVPSLQAALDPHEPSASCEVGRLLDLLWKKHQDLLRFHIFEEPHSRELGEHICCGHVELDGLGLCLSLWEISEGRTCYLLLDLEIWVFLSLEPP